MIQSKEVVKGSLFAGPSCLFPCSQAIMSGEYLAGVLCNGMQGEFGIHGGVSAIVGDILKPLAFVCVVTAIELLLQQAAAASTALQGVFALGALFFWLVGDLIKTFAFGCVTTATELLLQQAAAALPALVGAFALVVHYIWLVGDLMKSLFRCCDKTASEEVQQQAAAAAFEFVFGLVDLEFVPESDREVGHNTASSLIVGIGDQASGRVDVPGGGSQPAAAASQVIGKVPGQFETEHEVR